MTFNVTASLFQRIECSSRAAWTDNPKTSVQKAASFERVLNISAHVNYKTQTQFLMQNMYFMNFLYRGAMVVPRIIRGSFFMRKIILAAVAVCFSVPALAQTAVTTVTQVTTYGSNAAQISQSARNAAGAALTQATFRGNNYGSIAQLSQNTAAVVAQGTVRGNNAVSVQQAAPTTFWRHRR